MTHAGETDIFMSAILAGLNALLQVKRFRHTSEAELQKGLAIVLSRGAWKLEREVELAKGDRIDFLMDGRIGIEVKIGGSHTEVLAQLHRYAKHPRIEGLLLVTTRAGHGMPETLNDKPIRVCHLRGGLQ